jgi:hypothetical protein
MKLWRNFFYGLFILNSKELKFLKGRAYDNLTVLDLVCVQLQPHYLNQFLDLFT